MAKKDSNFRRTLFVFVFLILNLCWVAVSTACDTGYGDKTRGTCFPPPVYINIVPQELNLEPGESVTCDVYIEVSSYNKPFDIWLWLEGVPLEWTAKLNKSYFSQVYPSDRCTLNISISEDSPVGTSRPIYISGFWRSGNETGWVGYLSTRVTRYFKTQVYIVGPDLNITYTDFTIINDYPLTSQPVIFRAMIHNTGDINASDVSVRFLVDNEQIGKVQYIPVLNHGKSVPVFETWQADTGDHNITVEIDYENSIDEYSEENNVASFTLSVEEEPSKWVEYSTALSFILCIPLISILRNKRIKKKHKE